MADYLNVHDIPHRATRRDDTAPHQIVLTAGTGRGRSPAVIVGCVCTRRRLRTTDEPGDHWARFNDLPHDQRRAPFVPVDPATGRPAPPPVAEATP